MAEKPAKTDVLKQLVVPSQAARATIVMETTSDGARAPVNYLISVTPANSTLYNTHNLWKAIIWSQLSKGKDKQQKRRSK